MIYCFEHSSPRPRTEVIPILVLHINNRLPSPHNSGSGIKCHLSNIRSDNLFEIDDLNAVWNLSKYPICPLLKITVLDHLALIEASRCCGRRWWSPAFDDDWHWAVRIGVLYCRGVEPSSNDSALLRGYCLQKYLEVDMLQTTGNYLSYKRRLLPKTHLLRLYSRFNPCLLCCSRRIPRLSLIRHSLYVGVVQKPLPPPLTGEQYGKMEPKYLFNVPLYLNNSVETATLFNVVSHPRCCEPRN